MIGLNQKFQDKIDGYIELSRKIKDLAPRTAEGKLGPNVPESVRLP